MASLTTWAAFCPCGQCYPRDQNKHTAAPVKVARQQTTREPSGTFATLPPTGRNLPPILPRNLHQHTPELSASGTYTSIRRNSPEPSSGTYTSIRRNSPEPSRTCFRNLHQHTPELSGTFRNLPPEPTPAYAGTLRNLPEPASGTYTSIRRNFPEPSRTCFRNLHQHTPELSGTFRNPSPEPTPHTPNFQEPSGTPLTPQNPLEPSGTFLRNLLLRPAPAHTGAYLGWRPH